MQDEKRKNATPIRKVQKNAREMKYVVLSALSLITFFVLWELLVRFEVIGSRMLAPPTEIIRTFAEKFVSPKPDGSTLQVNILTSLQVVLSGFGLAVVIGIPLGLFMGWYRPIDRFIRPIFEVVRPIPPIAWIPYAILWFGIGLKAKAIIIFFSAFVPIVINTYTGIRLTNQTLINVAKTCGASNFQIFLRVGIPSSLPMMFAGIRISLGNAWGCVVAAEMLAANAGLGYMILMGRQFVRPDIVILGMLIIGLIGAALTGIVGQLEKRLIKGRDER